MRVVVSDALRAIPLLPGRFDFAFIDAEKEDYLDYLRQLEPKLVPGAVVVADNTGIARREVAPYLEYVRDRRPLRQPRATTSTTTPWRSRILRR